VLAGLQRSLNGYLACEEVGPLGALAVAADELIRR